MTQAPKNQELGLSIKAHLKVLGLSMSTMTPSNTIPPHTLTRHATTVILSLLMHFLTETATHANSMTIFQKSAVSSTLTLSLLLTCAAHAMVVRLCLKEKLVTTVKTGTKPLLDMLQIASRDFSVYIKNRLISSPFQECTTSVQNLKVLGPLKIDSDTGIIADTLMTFMMVIGSLKMESKAGNGTTLWDPALMESGKMTTIW